MLRFVLTCAVFTLFLSCNKEVSDRFDQEVSWIEQYISQKQLSAYQIRETGLYISHQYRSGLDLSPTVDNDLEIVVDLTCYDAYQNSTLYRLERDTLPLDDLVNGLKIGMTHVAIGDTVQLFVPSRLAYGESGIDMISPNTILKFDIYLFDIHPHF